MSDNKAKNPNRYGTSDDPFKVDERFSTGLMGHEQAAPVNTEQTLEEAEADNDAAMEAWGDQLAPEFRGKGKKNELREFVENATDADYLEAAKDIRDPEVLAKFKDDLEDRRQGMEAEKFLKLRPEYHIDERNFDRLVNYLNAHEMEFTAENLCVAYDELFAEGHLVVDRSVVKPLTEKEELKVARMVIAGRIEEALWAYLESSLPGRHPGEIKQLVAISPEYSDLVREAVYFIFRHATVDYQHNPAFIDYAHKFADERPWSLELLQSAWTAFKRDAVVQSQQGPTELTPEQIDAMTPEQQENLLRETRKLRAQQLRKQSSY